MLHAIADVSPLMSPTHWLVWGPLGIIALAALYAVRAMYVRQERRDEAHRQEMKALYERHIEKAEKWVEKNHEAAENWARLLESIEKNRRL